MCVCVCVCMRGSMSVPVHTEQKVYVPVSGPWNVVRVSVPNPGLPCLCPRTGVPWSDEHSSWEEQQAAGSLGETAAGGHFELHSYCTACVY